MKKFLILLMFILIFGINSPQSSFKPLESPQSSFEGTIGNQYWAYAGSPGAVVNSYPVIGDFDLDGNVEIVFHENGFQPMLKCIYGSNGSLKWSVPLQGIWNPILAANVDDDPALELIMNVWDGTVQVRSAINGSLKWATEPVTNSPITVGDVDGDGKPEIITTSAINYSILCYDGKGQLKYSVLPIDSFTSVHQFALLDVDGDGQTEIIAVNPSLNKTLSLRGSTGIEKWKSNSFPSTISTAPIPLDLDHDGKIDIIFGTNNGYINVLHGSNGTTKWSKNATYAANINTQFSSLLIADVNQDDHYEIFFGSNNGMFVCLNETGDTQWTYNATSPISGVGIIADIDGDYEYEVLFVANASVIVLDAKTGQFEWKYQLQNSNNGFVECADVDGDGKLEIITGTIGSPYLYCLIGYGQPWLQPGPVSCYGGSQFHTGDYQDTDGDKIPDPLERWIKTNPNSNDTDGDGVNDYDEIKLLLNPNSKDSDSDSMWDAWELTYQFDPLDPSDADLDPDADLVLNKWEFSNGTDPRNPDTDGDGMPDGWEIKYQLDPLNSSDAQLDPDKDYSKNLKEYLRGTDPRNPDTDGDGIPDGFDPFPTNKYYDYLILGGGVAAMIGVSALRHRIKNSKVRDVKNIKKLDVKKTKKKK